MVSSSVPALVAGQSAADLAAPRRVWLALVPLLIGTFLGTLNNNIVNVPMRQIMADLRVPLPEGALVVIAFNLTFAVLMPLTGWLGDRVGRRRLYCWAVATVAAGAIGAFLAPSLAFLVGFRVVQGAGTAAILPTVMGMIGDLYGHARRGRALGLWAAANGLGQAVGPPVGGLLTGVASWRLVFVPALPLAAFAITGALLLVPRSHPAGRPIDGRGAAALTLGAIFLIGGLTLVPIFGATSFVVWALEVAGIAALAQFAAGIRRRTNPFIPPRLLVEPSFLRSSLAVFAQMFCLGATLLAVPLYLTKGAGISPSRAGLLVFVLPAVMTVLAPLAGRCAEAWGPRRVLRAGMAVLVVGELAAAATLAVGGRGVRLEVVLALVGTGVAFVQTPAATGATRSEAGRVGTGLGVFNLVRFAGAAIGAAWVSIALAGAAGYLLLFVGCGVVAVVGLIGTYAGPDPG